MISIRIDIDECLTNNGECDVHAICSNTIGSYNCTCNPGYSGNGFECYPCYKNEYSFNDTTCVSCPVDSVSEIGSTSIIDCKCTSPNHYPNDQTFICTPCPIGYLLDDNSNTCQSNFSFFLN